MRLSEKSIELNFCSEAAVAAGLSAHPFWCGLTQQQEKNLGFDVAGRRGGRLLVYQFKASSQFSGGLRRFKAPHHQLQSLQRLATGPNQVFYVFPEIGTTAELVSAGSVTSKAWLCDVWHRNLRRLGPTHRRDNAHYVDLDPRNAVCVWHSETAEVPVVSAADWFSSVSEVRRGKTITPMQDEETIGIPLSNDAHRRVFSTLREMNSRKLLGLLLQ